MEYLHPLSTVFWTVAWVGAFSGAVPTKALAGDLARIHVYWRKRHSARRIYIRRVARHIELVVIYYLVWTTVAGLMLYISTRLMTSLGYPWEAWVGLGMGCGVFLGMRYYIARRRLKEKTDGA